MLLELELWVGWTCVAHISFAERLYDNAISGLVPTAESVVHVHRRSSFTFLNVNTTCMFSNHFINSLITSCLGVSNPFFEPFLHVA